MRGSILKMEEAAANFGNAQGDNTKDAVYMDAERRFEELEVVGLTHVNSLVALIERSLRAIW